MLCRIQDYNSAAPEFFKKNLPVEKTMYPYGFKVLSMARMFAKLLSALVRSISYFANQFCVILIPID